MEFEPFGKIARLSRDVVVTEKIDGTNGVIGISESGERMVVGSRSRWIQEGQDNHGFHRWAREHEDELRMFLGPGLHYGEWWGQGIQRGYGLKEKRFSLFNVSRWQDSTLRPACCDVVPEITRGTFTTTMVDWALLHLQEHGSMAAPGFMQPEGVVIFHAQGTVLFKKTIKNDDRGKEFGG